MPRRRTNRAGSGRRDERGASAVEFALVLPIFLLLVLGIIQYGTIFLLRNQMTQAASDAGRSAVTYTDPTAAQSAAATALAADVAHDSAGLTGGSDPCSSSAFTCDATTQSPGSSPGCPSTVPHGYMCLLVTVTYDYGNHPVLALPFIPTPSTIKASSTVIIGNGALVG